MLFRSPEQNPAPKEAESAKEAPKEPSPPAKEERRSSPADEGAPTAPTTGGSSAGKAQKQKYPLYPSVQHLLRENGLPKEEADKIPATGPNGRLLKGDVLAYLGRIKDNYTSELSERIAKLLS